MGRVGRRAGSREQVRERVSVQVRATIWSAPETIASVGTAKHPEPPAVEGSPAGRGSLSSAPPRPAPRMVSARALHRTRAR